MRATGSFEVDMLPLESATAGTDGNQIGRFALRKSFSGDLDAHSKGEMLSVRTAVASSAGYVAVEEVRGTLNGRSGTFVLQHFGLMHGEANRLVLEVVPDSGTGELAGLAGEMMIEVDEGRHLYDLVYELR